MTSGGLFLLPMTQEDEENLPLVVGDVIHHMDGCSGFCSHLLLAVEEKILITLMHEDGEASVIERWDLNEKNRKRLAWMNQRWIFL